MRSTRAVLLALSILGAQPSFGIEEVKIDPAPKQEEQKDIDPIEKFLENCYAHSRGQTKELSALQVPDLSTSLLPGSERALARAQLIKQSACPDTAPESLRVPDVTSQESSLPGESQ